MVELFPELKNGDTTSNNQEDNLKSIEEEAICVTFQTDDNADVDEDAVEA